MRKSDRDRLVASLEAVAEGPDRTSAYDAITTAERDESDPATQRRLHEAAVALLHSQFDATRLDQVRQLLSSIEVAD